MQFIIQRMRVFKSHFLKFEVLYILYSLFHWLIHDILCKCFNFKTSTRHFKAFTFRKSTVRWSSSNHWIRSLWEKLLSQSMWLIAIVTTANSYCCSWGRPLLLCLRVIKKPCNRICLSMTRLNLSLSNKFASRSGIHIQACIVMITYKFRYLNVVFVSECLGHHRIQVFKGCLVHVLVSWNALANSFLARTLRIQLRIAPLIQMRCLKLNFYWLFETRCAFIQKSNIWACYYNFISWISEGSHCSTMHVPTLYLHLRTCSFWWVIVCHLSCR